jgi:serine/threonine protein kinase/tetratricopeptide (TPR) repeat protein
MIGTTLGHYRILESLGSGGMGVVYRARDERLLRDVALKLLPPDTVLDETARGRLRREALTLSRINHPGIGAVYDLGADGGVDYVVMELVPGETLDERLGGGPLPEAEVVAIGIQAAEGLAAAHREGVIHRDVKPANLKVTPDGRTKILDFGVAFLSDPLRERPETATRSDADVVAGTLAYMAPEQLLGEPVDARTDVYGLGVTLYELATGRRPFRAPLPAPMIDAILHEVPEHPCAARPGLSRGLAEVLLRCLEKRPERRFRTADELAADLRALAAGTGGSPGGTPVARRPLQSVAVLPLENLSRDPEQEYFADGMTEALIAGLAKVRGLRVISRTSVMRFKEERPSLPEIARALHVDALVEGSVLRSGSRVRITANLIDAGADRHLWSDSYDRDLVDLLALTSDVATAIAREVQCRLIPDEEAAAPRRAIDPDAVQAYLKGRFYWERRSEEGVGRAIEFFNQAVERDPQYALAHVGLADSYLVLANFSIIESRSAATRARAAARRALELDPSLGEAYTSLATIADIHDWKRADAEQLYRRAIELSPNYATAHHWYSDHLTSLARFDEAMGEVRRAQDLDPLSMIISTSVGTVLNYARKHREAVDHLLGALDLDPRFTVTWMGLGGAYEQLGEFDRAIEAFSRARELSGGSTYTILALAHALAVSGRREEALAEVEGVQGGTPRRYVSPYSLAAVHTGLDDRERAFGLLERAYAERDRALIWLPVSPRLDPLRSDPRLRKYLEAVGAS